MNCERPVTVRVVRDDGQEMSFGSGTDWNILDDGLENWANLPHSVEVTENVEYDGGTVTSKRIETVDRTVSAMLADSRLNEPMREKVVRFFNAKHSFEAHLTYQGRTRWCQGEQLAFKCDAGNVFNAVRFSWTILCPMPFLLSEDDFGQDIASVDPKFGFPLYSCTSATGTAKRKANAQGFVWGAFAFARKVELVNDGDVPTYCRAIITATGDVTNPKLINGSKFVRLVDTMKEGDVLEVDFVKRPPTVRKNGENVIQKTDRLSSFVGLRFDVGKNVLQYDADNGSNAMSVALYYNKRYLGI